MTAAIASLAREAFAGWRRNRSAHTAAALAYYTLFAVTPVVIFALALAGAVFGERAARGELVHQIARWVSRGVAEFVEAMVLRIRGEDWTGLTTVLVALTLIYGATNVFSQAKLALNAIWGIDQPGGIRYFFHSRLIGFGFVALAGVLLLASLIVTTSLALIAAALGDAVPSWLDLLRTGETAFSLIMLTMVFAISYRILPDIALTWRDVLPGAIVTALLFTLGAVLLKNYLAGSGVRSTFGAAGSVVVLLIFVNYAASVFLYGAELTRAYTLRYGSLRPAEPESQASSDEAAVN